MTVVNCCGLVPVLMSTKMITLYTETSNMNLITDFKYN
ncbi:hypothetical protein TcasGA2_TC031377 [Tribolium castaneum]|uniref:Uncharacterized protein n=1 Tax=Tribolium castaneum TaxID=7070 RepID=A0A139WB69_TRICA|nr:hypothetical protein TcasGA2_TC031377 [Tribolium castaneum]